MKRIGQNKGFTLIELMTVLAILVVLALAAIKVTKYVRDAANEGLTESTIDVIVTALEQYYEDNKEFPIADYVVTSSVSNFVNDDLERLIEADLRLVPPPDVVTLNGANNHEHASIAAMYYFLNKSYNSSKILSAISGKFLTAKDSTGGALTAEWPVPGSSSVPPTKTVPLIRIVDVWGNALRYEYAFGESFPVIVSAGKDGKFNTVSDNISSDDL